LFKLQGFNAENEFKITTADNMNKYELIVLETKRSFLNTIIAEQLLRIRKNISKNLKICSHKFIVSITVLVKRRTRRFKPNIQTLFPFFIIRAATRSFINIYYLRNTIQHIKPNIRTSFNILKLYFAAFAVKISIK